MPGGPTNRLAATQNAATITHYQTIDSLSTIPAKTPEKNFIVVRKIIRASRFSLHADHFGFLQPLLTYIHTRSHPWMVLRSDCAISFSSAHFLPGQRIVRTMIPPRSGVMSTKESQHGPQSLRHGRRKVLFIQNPAPYDTGCAHFWLSSEGCVRPLGPLCLPLHDLST
jgi:hypothetical protein